MKRLFLFFLLTPFLYSQVEIRGGMGINFINSPSFRDYLNQSFRPVEEISSFNSAVNFSLEGGYYLTNNFVIGLEGAYLLNSFNFPADVGNIEIAYDIILPSLTAYYVMNGTGYNFKFGGGAGPRFVNVEDRRSIETKSYTSVGFGVLLRADGNTSLGGNLYANIGGDIRYDLNGIPENGQAALNNFITKEDVDLNSFSLGVRLGLTYIF